MSENIGGSRWRPSRLWSAIAYGLVGLRWFVLLGWIAIAAAAVMYLPAIGQQGEDLSDMVSTGNPAVQTEMHSFQKFGFPLLSRVEIVQRNPKGLSTDVQARALQRAKDLSDGKFADAKPILAAIPVSNAMKVVPGSKENGTTIITMLFMPPDVALPDQVTAAQAFVANHYQADDSVIGVTGSVPARVEQGDIVLSHIDMLEIVTVIAVFLIVALAFRSIVAPIMALAVAGVAILITLHVGGWLAERFGISVPQEAQPLLVALLLGVVTDYVVFYLSAARSQLAQGVDRQNAAHMAAARFSPIIATAGLTAAAGTGALIVADAPTFRAFGPGMGVAVLVGMIVAVTLVPALLAIFGSWLMWGPRRGAPAEETVDHEEIQREVTAQRWWSRILTWPGFSFLLLLACVGGLLWAAAPVRHMSLGVSFVEALPANHPARRAATEAGKGFADGILSPTELLVEGSGLGSRKAELAKLQKAISNEPGVAAVIGPADDVIPQVGKLFATDDGQAVRYLIIMKTEPLGATAIKNLTHLEKDMPNLVRQAGLDGVQASAGGDTGIAKAVVDQTVHDLGRIALAALLANLLFLALYLRALIAPFALLCCSVLAIAATLGLTTKVFEDILGHDGVTFYVPFAAAVLLVALGSDYNIFGIGPAWKEARTRPLREALAITLPQSARAIRTAAFTLAVSFGLLVMIPLRPFQELAFALSVGILLDAFVVRSLLAPALLSVIGTASQWPGKQLWQRRHPQSAQPAEAPESAPVPKVFPPRRRGLRTKKTDAREGANSGRDRSAEGRPQERQTAVPGVREDS
jgi:putative drug exporter of the RND superfamily